MIEGGEDADIMDGGAGSDTLSYRMSTTGVHVIFADALSPTGISVDTGDTVSNFEGVIGSSFDDILDGSSSTIALHLDGNAGADEITGGSGNDIIVGGNDSDSDFITGGAGDDNITASSSDYVYGGLGADTIVGEYATMISGDEGDDHITALEGEIYGGDGADFISATDAIVYGEAGNDTITVLRGSVYGGDGADIITAVGSPTSPFDITPIEISAGEGDDTINLTGSGGNFNISYSSVDGNDTIIKDDAMGISGKINLNVSEEYTSIDVYIDYDRSELLDSNPDTSDWNVIADIKVNFSDGFLWVKNTHAYVYSSGSGISPMNFSSDDLFITDTPLYLNSNDANFFVI